MEQISNCVFLFFSLIRVALGLDKSLSRTPSLNEWKSIFRLAKEQTLLGVCFYGIKQLPENEIVQLKNDKLFFQWLSMTAEIQRRNRVLNQECVELLKRLSPQIQCCILKGQGIAQLYNNDLKLLRQSGDIDVWLNCSVKEIIKWLSSTNKEIEIGDHHVSQKGKKGIEIEYHYTPCALHNLFNNRRLQSWIKSNAERQFRNYISISGKNKIIVPTEDFNIVFLLVHMHRHFFGEGLGLRQVMDYYFLLSCSHFNKGYTSLLKSLGLLRFSRGLMWMLSEIFHLNKKFFICQEDEKIGRFLLSEIMAGGNFGQYGVNRRPTEGNSHLHRFCEKIKVSNRYFRYFPSESFWTPICYAREYVISKILNT